MRSENVQDIYPLSPLQQGLLFHAVAAEEPGLYFQELTCLLRGELDPAAFEEAWKQVLERHPALRTAFVWKGVEQPVQVVLRQVELPFEVEDWRGVAAADRPRRLAAYLEANRTAGFDPARAPLMRVALLRLEDDLHRLVWSHHHLILDGWSIPIVVREVFVLYEALRQGITPRLPRRRPYRDYIAWVQEQDPAAAERYWRDTLAGLEGPTRLAVERPPRRRGGGGRGDLQVRLSAERTEELRRAAGRQQITLNTLVQGAWAVLLSRYGGGTDVTYGAITSGRPPELDGSDRMVGLFINTLPVRVRVRPEATVADWLRDLQESQAEQRQHEHTPLRQVQAWSPVQGKPLFETLLDFASYPLDESLADGGDAFEPSLEISGVTFSERTNYPLALIAAPSRELPLRALFDGQRLDGPVVERLLRHVEALLEGFLDDPGRRLAEWSHLTAAERMQLTRGWNDTWRDFDDRQTLDSLFAAQARRRPEATAVVWDGGELSYRQVARHAHRLAHHLGAHGGGHGAWVGVFLERGWEMVPALLGVVTAGAAYVPLDTSYPADRIRWILTKLGVRHLVTQRSLLGRLEELGEMPGLEHVTLLEEAADAGDDAAASSQQTAVAGGARLWDGTHLAARPDSAPAPVATPEDLAYVIFTSGSTGRPKGVMERHRPAVNLIDWVNRTFSVGPDDRVLFVTSLCFDLSVYDVFGVLAAGGSVRVASAQAVREPERLARLLLSEPVTFWDSAPAALQQLVPHLPAEPPEPPAALRLVFQSGDWVPVALPDRIRQTFPEAEVISLGGATEATVWSNFFPVAEVDPAWTSIPYGRPIQNARYYVLDDRLEPCPVGVAGDLYIGGDCLASGYAAQPALTADRFGPDPFGEKPGAVMYRTGDRARFWPDGNLEFLGRLDAQVKIRGYRIELGEVETVLAEHPEIGACAVLAREDEPGHQRLVAYLVPQPGAAAVPPAGELRDFLGRKLPDYMVPAAFVELADLPVTANGKLDRKALPAPEDVRRRAEGDFEPPRTGAEEILAEVWGKVLRVKGLGVRDNFFELGGDSILSLQVVSAAAQRGLRVTSAQLFSHQTVAELARVARPAQAGEAEQKPVVGPVPLTPVQRWFLEQDMPHPEHFNQALHLAVKTPLDPARLARALDVVAAHHDALRLRLVSDGAADGAAPEQRFAPVSEVPSLLRADLTGVGAARRPAALRRLANALQTSLHLQAGPVLRAALVEVDDELPQRLLVVIHHLAVDGVSWRVLLEDLQAVYGQLATGARPTLPAKTASYRQWGRHLEKLVEEGHFDDELDHWLALGGDDLAGLPVDRPGGAGESGKAGESGAAPWGTVAGEGSVSVSLDEDETRELLERVPEAYHSRVDDALLSALARAVHAWTGHPRLLVELEGHGREEVGEALGETPGEAPDLSRTVGWFTAIYPVLLDVTGATSPGEALMRVKEGLRAVPRRGVGYGALRYLAPPAVAGRLAVLPVPEIGFNYFGRLDRALPEDSPFRPAQESAGRSRHPSQPRRHLLEVNGGVTGGRLQMDWRFNHELHDEATVRHLAELYLEALRHLVEHCRSPEAGGHTPSDFPLADLGPEDLALLLQETPDLEDVYPLAPLQEGLLFHSVSGQGGESYLAQLAYRVRGPLDLDRLEESWRRLVARHGVLRTRFQWEGLPRPLQVVGSAVDLPFQRVDHRSLPREEREDALTAFLERDRRAGFDIGRAPLMRLAAITWEDDLTEVVWSFHHLLLDGWSMPLLLREVFAHYQALACGEAAPLPEPPRYRDYIAWLAQRDEAQAREYWRRALADGAEGQAVASEVPGSGDGGGGRGEHRGRLPQELTSRIDAFARRHRLTLNTVVQGALALFLAHQTGRDRACFGVVVAGRPPELPEAERMPGMFINNLPLALPVQAGEAVLDWLQRVQGEAIEMRRYEYASLSQIRRWCSLPSRGELFQCTLAFNNYPVGEALAGESRGDTEVERVLTVERTTLPLDFTFTPGREMSLRVMYDAGRYRESEIAAFEAEMGLILDRLTAEGHATLGDVLDAVRRRQEESRSQRRRSSFDRFKKIRPDTHTTVAVGGATEEC